VERDSLEASLLQVRPRSPAAERGDATAMRMLALILRKAGQVRLSEELLRCGGVGEAIADNRAGHRS
jgi:hypothetical protein